MQVFVGFYWRNTVTRHRFELARQAQSQALAVSKCVAAGQRGTRART